MIEIRKEFLLIDADIVICGSTFKSLYKAIVGDFEIDDSKIYSSGKGDNWFYYLNLDKKRRLYIDMYHPANRWPDMMNYYTLVSIYQQALKDFEQHNNES